MADNGRHVMFVLSGQALRLNQGFFFRFRWGGLSPPNPPKSPKSRDFAVSGGVRDSAGGGGGGAGKTLVSTTYLARK